LHIEYGGPDKLANSDNARFGRLYRDEPGAWIGKNKGPSRLYWPLRKANVEQYR
jgi:hypothetical protein